MTALICCAGKLYSRYPLRARPWAARTSSDDQECAAACVVPGPKGGFVGSRMALDPERGDDLWGDRLIACCGLGLLV